MVYVLLDYFVILTDRSSYTRKVLGLHESGVRFRNTEEAPMPCLHQNESHRWLWDDTLRNRKTWSLTIEWGHFLSSRNCYVIDLYFIYVFIFSNRSLIFIDYKTLYTYIFKKRHCFYTYTCNKTFKTSLSTDFVTVTFWIPWKKISIDFLSLLK